MFEVALNGGGLYPALALNILSVSITVNWADTKTKKNAGNPRWPLVTNVYNKLHTVNYLVGKKFIRSMEPVIKK